MPLFATMSFLYALTYSSIAYLIPAYETYKAIERKGEVEVKEWATYWVVLASLVLLGWLLDFTLSWLPFYFVIKLVFICALWHPSTKWALYVYTKLFGPLVSTYEADIDRFVAEGRVKAADMVNQHGQTLKSQAGKFSGRATVMLKNIQQKAMEKAMAKKAAQNPGYAAAEASVGHGLHAE
jgi:hypothetical protein